jgi:homoserine dehydrogenase
VLAKVAAIFGDEGVSIRSVAQEGREEGAELVLVLHPVREAAFFAALARIAALDEVEGRPAVIRVEGQE